MLGKLFKLILGMAAGTALAYYATSDRGRALLAKAREGLQVAVLETSRLNPGAGGEADDEAEGAIEAKIEETRRRLREQLDKAAHGSTGETEIPR